MLNRHNITVLYGVLMFTANVTFNINNLKILASLQNKADWFETPVNKIKTYLHDTHLISLFFILAASPESFIVGSIKRSKPVMRTISGSNFWHLV